MANGPSGHPNQPPFPPSVWHFNTQAPWATDFEHDYRERDQPLTFVLIHGSWADASFWSGIAAELRKKGHTVYVPEYPGHGADPNKAVTHAMMTQSIADYVTSRNLKNIILVGHSFGGSLVQKVAELIPDRYMSSRLGLYRFIQVHGDHMSTAQFEPKLIARKLYEASRD